MGSRTLLISDADVEEFARLSRDVNPLHVSADYARRTPFGERVVFGVLGALSAMGALSPRSGVEVAEASFDFPGPIFVGQAHEIIVDEASPDRAKLRVQDGRRVCLRATLRFRKHEATPARTSPGGPTSRSVAEHRSREELRAGLEAAGHYSPNAEALDALVSRLGLESKGIRRAQAAALACMSYLVGMEIPGRDALFSGAKVTFLPSSDAELDYVLRVQSADDRFGLLSLDASLTAGDAPCAHARLTAFARDPIAPPDMSATSMVLAPSERLREQVALVTGASRGLGASLALALASQQCQVLATYRASHAEARAVASQAPDYITLLCADMSSSELSEAVQEEVARRERLDILVCNAAPPVRSLWIEPASIDRILGFVAQSVSMMLNPVAHLVGALAKSGGVLVVVSSSGVAAPPAEWPHYVAAKLAIEGLAQVAAAEHPGLRVVIARPPKLLTDLVNTPMGRQDAMSPDAAGALLARRIIDAQSLPPGVTVLDAWGEGQNAK